MLPAKTSELLFKFVADGTFPRTVGGVRNQKPAISPVAFVQGLTKRFTKRFVMQRRTFRMKLRRSCWSSATGGLNRQRSSHGRSLTARSGETKPLNRKRASPQRTEQRGVYYHRPS